MNNKLYFFGVIAFVFESIFMLMHGYFFKEFADKKMNLSPAIENIAPIGYAVGIPLVVIIAMLGFCHFGEFESKMAKNSNRVMEENRFQMKGLGFFFIFLLLLLFVAEIFVIYKSLYTGNFGNPNAFDGGAFFMAVLFVSMHYITTGALVYYFYQKIGSQLTKTTATNLGMADK